MKLFFKSDGAGAFTGVENGVEWAVRPNKASEIPDEAGEKLMKAYPDVFTVLSASQDSPDKLSAKDAEINDLRAELEKLRSASVAAATADAAKPAKVTVKAAK